MFYMTIELEKRWPLSSQKFVFGISDVFVLLFLFLLFVYSIFSCNIPWFSWIIIFVFSVPCIHGALFSLPLGVRFFHFHGKNLGRYADHVSINFCNIRYKFVKKLCNVCKQAGNNRTLQYTILIIVNHVIGFLTLYKNKLNQNSFLIIMIVNVKYVTEKELQP